MKLVSKSLVDAPTHIVKCSGTTEHAMIVSVKSGTFCKISWLKECAEEDEDKIRIVNLQLPDLPEITSKFRGKLRKSMTDVLLVKDHMLCLEEKIKLGIPDAIYLQRISARTRTFDLVCFYGTAYEMFSAVDKKDLETIREWYPKEIFQCGADPLPLKAISKQLEACTHEEIMEELFGESSEEESSEYEPDSDDELEDDHEIEGLVDSDDEDEQPNEQPEEPEQPDEQPDEEPKPKRRKI